jgi:hypothetical protein
MNLQSFVSLAAIVNALAVTLSLVVVIISIRQNTKAQRVTSVQSLSAAIAAINVPAIGIARARQRTVESGEGLAHGHARRTHPLRGADGLTSNATPRLSSPASVSALRANAR